MGQLGVIHETIISKDHNALRLATLNLRAMPWEHGNIFNVLHNLIHAYSIVNILDSRTFTRVDLRSTTVFEAREDWCSSTPMTFKDDHPLGALLVYFTYIKI